MLNLIKSPSLALEDVKDYRYNNVSSIIMPASKILIGTNGSLDDARLYESGQLTFDFGNGVGDNGLDSGVEAQDQWYALYAVPKTGTSQYVLKASISAPHAAGGNGPSGYSKYRYLGLFRNGGNGYDTTAGYGRGDIVRFIKNNNIMYFQAFHSDLGGQYPAASGMQGIQVFIANTATNGVALDSTSAANFGFSGLSVSGVKLPYKFASYLWEGQINQASPAMIHFTDASGNIRKFSAMSPNSGGTLYSGESWNAFSEVDTWVAHVRLQNQAGGNVSRYLGVRALRDPYTMGGI